MEDKEHVLLSQDRAASRVLTHMAEALARPPSIGIKGNKIGHSVSSVRVGFVHACTRKIESKSGCEWGMVHAHHPPSAIQV